MKIYSFRKLITKKINFFAIAFTCFSFFQMNAQDETFNSAGTNNHWDNTSNWTNSTPATGKATLGGSDLDLNTYTPTLEEIYNTNTGQKTISNGTLNLSGGTSNIITSWANSTLTFDCNINITSTNNNKIIGTRKTSNTILIFSSGRTLNLGSHTLNFNNRSSNPIQLNGIVVSNDDNINVQTNSNNNGGLIYGSTSDFSNFNGIHITTDNTITSDCPTIFVKSGKMLQLRGTGEFILNVSNTVEGKITRNKNISGLARVTFNANQVNMEELTVDTYDLALKFDSDVTSIVFSSFVTSTNQGIVDLESYESGTLKIGGTLSTAILDTWKLDGIEPENGTIRQDSQGYITIAKTWTGAVDTNWSTAGNWDSGVPSSSDNVIIPDTTNAPIINGSTNVSVNDLNIIESDGLTIDSDGSLIVSGISSGNVTYKRNLSTTNWYLVSSPVVGQSFNSFETANNIATGTGSNIGIAPYVTSDDSWDYLESGESTSFTPGNGYSVKLSSASDISFTGTLNVADNGIDVVLDNSGNRYNLLGNPYTSNIASATFLTNETAVSETQTLWVWNQSTEAYEVKTIGDAMIIAPAQGFLVRANSSGGTFNFDESNQAGMVGSSTFQRTENRPEIHLTLSDQTDTRIAKIYYEEDMTTGFDVGYEGELFNGVSNSLAIYTHLITDSEGKNYQVQSLPFNNNENTVIPVGINAESGTSITIKVSKTNFPTGVNIYLEDKQDDSLTLIEDDTNFTTTIENSLFGIGRFYLHTTSASLSVSDLTTNKNVSIYNTNRENLRIVGVQNETATIQLYNIIGKEILRTSFEGNGLNDIPLPNLKSGLYIINLTTEKRTLSKKIIIQ